MSTLRFLVADDELHLSQILSYNLGKTGAQVETVGNGQQLLDRATATMPDVIVTDYQMPVLDGYQACVQLRQDPRTAGIPVVMLTARGHRLSAAELGRTNIRVLLPKPFSVKQLLGQIEKLTGTPV